MDELTLFLWEHLAHYRTFAFIFVCVFIALMIWVVFKFGFKEQTIFLVMICSWIFFYLFMNEVKVNRDLGFPYYRLMHYFHPWITSLLSFILFISIKWGKKFILPVIIAWLVVFAFNLSQPNVLDPVIRPPLWWLPEFKMYGLNATWVVACYLLLGYIIYQLLNGKGISKFWRFAIPYYLYVGIVLFVPLMFVFFHGYKFVPGQDPLGLFNSISLKINSGKGHWIMSSLAIIYLGYTLLLLSMGMVGYYLVRTGFRDLREQDPINELRSKLTGKHLEYFGYVRAGLSNAEIAEEMQTDKATVSKQLYNIKRKLGLEENLRTHLSRINLESSKKS